MEQLLDKGLTGLFCIVLVVIFAPIIRAFICEIKAGRVERQEQGEAHRKETEANRLERQREAEAHRGIEIEMVRSVDRVTAGLERVHDSLDGLSRRINGDARAAMEHAGRPE